MTSHWKQNISYDKRLWLSQKTLTHVRCNCYVHHVDDARPDSNTCIIEPVRSKSNLEFGAGVIVYIIRNMVIKLLRISIFLILKEHSWGLLGPWGCIASDPETNTKGWPRPQLHTHVFPKNIVSPNYTVCICKIIFQHLFTWKILKNKHKGTHQAF